MTPPLRDHEEAHNTLVELALSAMHRFDENTLGSASFLQGALQKTGIPSSVLKRKRHGYYDDAYILGLDFEGQRIAVKIHEDCFKNCKQIYDTPELLERLKASGDIAPVLSTTRIGKYRVVFYIWQDGKTPLEKIGEGPESCRELTEALRLRIESLLRKEQGLHGIGDSFTYPEEGEFLYTPEGLIVLDINKIIPMKILHLSATELAQRIIHTWIQRNKTK